MELDIKIGEKIYTIPCKESEKEQLLQFAKIVNKKFYNLKSNIAGLDQETILAVMSLLAQGEIENIKNQKAADLEDDIYDAISDTTENITDYIKKFTQRIQKY